MNKLYILFVTGLLFWGCSKTDISEKENGTYPIADGTFIQDWLFYNWDDTRWQQELSALKDAGMHYIIIAPTLHTDKSEIVESIYPSSLPGVKQKYTTDLVDICLRNAAKADFKVFLGLNFNENWWNADFSEDWLKQEMMLGNKVADELISKYKDKYGDVLYGWYWVWEVDNLNFKTIERQNALANSLNINLDHLHTVAPSMPFMFCPFVNYECGTSSENQKMWIYVFSKTHFQPGDIFAPQDCIGAGGLKINILDSWFNDMKGAVDTKPGLLFWSDAETFDQRFWTIAPLNRFVEQMKIIKPYVSNIISFAYSHYYSPLNVNKKYHEVYLEYVRTGSLPNLPVLNPVQNLQLNVGTNGKPLLKWRKPTDEDEIAGYYIFRNDELIENIQYDYNYKNKEKYAFQEEEPLTKGSYLYAIYPYSFTGKYLLKTTINCEIK